MSRTATSDTPPPVWVTRNTVTSAGVTTIPIRLENDALHIAAATFPFAMDVNAIEDCTVDGRQHKNITPAYKSGVNNSGTNTRESKPSNGKNTKVNTTMTPCNRQCRTPANAARVDNRAPYKKNNKPIAMVVAWAKPSAPTPRAGSTDANPTVTSSSRI